LRGQRKTAPPLPEARIRSARVSWWKKTERPPIQRKHFPVAVKRCMSEGPLGIFECLSHEILEKVAVCLDLDNLKKLSKVSTSFRNLTISVRLKFKTNRSCTIYFDHLNV
jgi:hypothetical protein